MFDYFFFPPLLKVSIQNASNADCYIKQMKPHLIIIIEQQNIISIIINTHESERDNFPEAAGLP